MVLGFYQCKIDIEILLNFISISETFISSLSLHAVLTLIINSYRELLLSKIMSIFPQIEI